MSLTSEPVPAAVPRTAVPTTRDWVRLLRPAQWTKNLFVLAPLLFSGRGTDPDALVAAAIALAAFCLLASAVYAVNDVADRDSDRSHPIKQSRPVASGRITVSAALMLAGGLMVAGLGAAWVVSPSLAALAAGYLALNLLYNVWLKHVVILDVFALAAFFLLRLLAGAVAIKVQPSIWLLICGGLLALYLGFAKRRHELVLLGEDSIRHRKVLGDYGPAFLDQMSVVLLAVTIVAYIMYTLSPERVALSGHGLTYSVVFVLYGVFRYLYLVHQRGGGSPTETLLTDRSLIIDVTLWALYCGWVVYHPVLR
jgi:4-hydroxybenzoate polyprenyltransferase